MKHNSKNYFILGLKVTGLLTFIFVTSAIKIYLEKEKKKKYDDEVKRLNGDKDGSDDNTEDDVDYDDWGDDYMDSNVEDDVENGHAVEGFSLKEKAEKGECIVQFSKIFLIVYYILYFVSYIIYFVLKSFFGYIYSKFPPFFKTMVSPFVEFLSIVINFSFKTLYYLIEGILNFFDSVLIFIMDIINLLTGGILMTILQNLFGALLSPFYFLKLDSVTKYFSLFCWSKEGLRKDFARFADSLKNVFPV